MPRKKSEKTETGIAIMQTEFLSAEILKNPQLAIEKPFSREIFLFNTYIAGLPYVRDIKKLSRKLHVGDEVLLIREPSNTHDELAIVVHNTKDMKLGYVPRINNGVIARLMDAGKNIIARVSKVEDRAKEDRNATYALSIYIDIYMID